MGCVFAYVAFAYNRSSSQINGWSIFEPMWGRKPTNALDLAPLVTTQF